LNYIYLFQKLLSLQKFLTIKFMATYSITINEKMTLGKNLIAYIQSIPQAVRFDNVSRKKSGLEEALEDVAKGRLTTIHAPKKRGGLGILKGKIHYEGDVFNLSE
jgi:hypothetical protein